MTQHDAQNPAATDRGRGPKAAAPGRLGLPVVAALVALTLLGLALRVAGRDQLLPHGPEMDAQITTQVRALHEQGGWASDDPRPINDYPTLIARLSTLWRIDDPLAQADGPAALEQHLRAASKYHLRVRSIVACASAALVPATFLLARLFLGPWAALIAAAFVAFDIFHLLLAPQARAHGFAASAMLLAVLAAVRLRRRPTRSNYALAGLCAALALGSLHSGIFVLPALLWAHLRREGRAGRREFAGPLLALGCLLALGTWFYADILRAMLHQGALREGGKLTQGGHYLTLEMFLGRGLDDLAQLGLEGNPVLSLLALGGAALALRRWIRGPAQRELRADAGVLLAFALPYLLVLGLYERTYERLTLPLQPYLALLAAGLLAWAARPLRARWSGTMGVALCAAGALLMLAFPVYCGARLAWLRTQPDTYELAARYLDEHLPRGEVVILAPGVDLPRFYSRSSLVPPAGPPLPIRRLWIEYQQALEPGARTGRIQPFQVLVYGRRDTWHKSPSSIEALLHASPGDHLLLPILDSSLPEVDWMRAAAENWGSLVARFPGGARELDPPAYLAYGFSGQFLRDVLQARALGCELLLYRRRVGRD